MKKKFTPTAQPGEVMATDGGTNPIIIKEVELMNCPRCHVVISKFIHMHDAPYGLAGAHMSGSERYECPSCGQALTRKEANDLRLPYLFDKE